jgi:hypothetical protein
MTLLSGYRGPLDKGEQIPLELLMAHRVRVWRIDSREGEKIGPKEDAGGKAHSHVVLGVAAHPVS